MPHVLIVDDSPTELERLKATLEANGYQTSAARSAEEGITKAKEIMPDLILMDVVLPGMSGFQATRKIRRDPSTTSIPVVIMSVKKLDVDQAWGLRQGAREYLVKPLAEEELLNAVRRHALQPVCD